LKEIFNVEPIPAQKSRKALGEVDLEKRQQVDQSRAQSESDTDETYSDSFLQELRLFIFC
jgi:hypothetical protein